MRKSKHQDFRMSLISSAVTKAFHEDGVHARYMVTGGTPAPTGVILHLNPEEREVVEFSLTKMRDALYANDPDCIMAGHILGRISGGSTGQEQTDYDMDEQTGMTGLE